MPDEIDRARDENRKMDAQMIELVEQRGKIPLGFDVTLDPHPVIND
jgi:hypothetical protein